MLVCMILVINTDHYVCSLLTKEKEIEQCWERIPYASNLCLYFIHCYLNLCLKYHGANSRLCTVIITNHPNSSSDLYLM